SDCALIGYVTAQVVHFYCSFKNHNTKKNGHYIVITKHREHNAQLRGEARNNDITAWHFNTKATAY
ncbi:hypothetical protein, partial [Vibrio parahaemolyticus]|uniref:hypothetical protein n=1 Tax=Vibrio parahaemolyticus TaxID=670 RepID=UPI000AAFFF95